MTYTDVIDIESAKERFMGNYGLFSKYLYQFPERSLFAELETDISSGDAKKAFETAHTMKGIVGNLSLKLIEKPLHEMVEILRGGALPGDDKWSAFADAYRETVDVIGSLQAEGTSLF